VQRGLGEDTLDQGLFRQAVEGGVEIIFNSPKDHRSFGDIVASGYFSDEVTDAIVVGYNFRTNIENQYWVIIDDALAPDGYCYFFVNLGQATLAVCMFRDYEKSRDYLDRTYQIFLEHVDFESQDKKFFSGTSNGFLMRQAIFDGRLYVGEAAGFIEGMWGFGMKFALISGYLAAQSIIKGEDYEKLWKKELYPQIKASLVNRWYYKMLNKKSYQFMAQKMKDSKDPIAFLNKFSNYSLIHKIGYPFAFMSLRKKLKDRRKFK